MGMAIEKQITMRGTVNESPRRTEDLLQRGKNYNYQCMTNAVPLET